MPKHTSVIKRRISVTPDRPVKTPKRQNLTNFGRLRILDYYHENFDRLQQHEMIPFLREMGYITIVASTLSRLIQCESKIREYVESHPQRLSEKRPPLLTLPEVDNVLCQWVIQRLGRKGARITGDMICEKGREFCRLLGYREDIIVFSNGWLQSFKTRMGLSRHVFHGEASSAPIERLEDERFRLLAIIVHFAPCDIYNIDETALLYCLVPNSGLAIHDMPGVNQDKKRITYAFCANMDGSDKRSPLVIGRARQARCFGGYTAYEWGYYYFWNTKAWMVHSIWMSFLADLDEDMRRQGRYILLLYDNTPSHKHNPADYPHVRVEFLAPNLTSWIQPMDGGIIASFIAQYKRHFVRLALNRDNEGIVNMYKIDQRQAMEMAASAWAAVTPQTIGTVGGTSAWFQQPPVSGNGGYANPVSPSPQKFIFVVSVIF
ncbi:unnamed protein product [Rhizoctonia solani]|uniref:HTH CENPB-type domain-containing protein n=1 Tax=Rhizoctonia solani TaxID=456999 RepID=A0A8H3BD75_9AGAM|nr:unnamed protein product [Rhizoctonia solani]